MFPIIIDIGYNSDWNIAKKDIEIIGAKSILIGRKQINAWFPEIENNLINIQKICKGKLKKQLYVLLVIILK